MKRLTQDEVEGGELPGVIHDIAEYRVEPEAGIDSDPVPSRSKKGRFHNRLKILLVRWHTLSYTLVQVLEKEPSASEEKKEKGPVHNAVVILEGRGPREDRVPGSVYPEIEKRMGIVEMNFEGTNSPVLYVCRVDIS